MGRITVSKAAKLANVSRTAIYDNIKKGNLSSHKNAKGTTVLDVAELERVFGSLGKVDKPKMTNPDNILQDNLTALQIETATLKAQNEALEKQVAYLEADKEYLKTELTRAHALLPAPKKRSWWPFNRD